MNNKTKTIIFSVAFILFIAGSALAYNALNKNVVPENSLEQPLTQNTPGEVIMPQESIPSEVVPQETIAPQKQEEIIPITETKKQAEIIPPPSNTKTPVQNSNVIVEQKQGTISEKDKAPTNNNIQKAPNFKVLDANGNMVSLSSFFGKPIVLNFWASWCPPCRSEMPEFNTVYNQMKNEVMFMMVDLVDGSRETKEKGEKYIKSQGFSFPVFYDINQEANRAYGISSIPTTIFINKNGEIVTRSRGAINEATLKQGIDMIK